MEAYNYEEEISNIIEEKDETDQLRENEKWGVYDLSTAVWVDSIVHTKEVSIQQKEQIADDNIAILKEKIQKLEEWKDKSTSKEKNDIEFFKTHLVLWHMRIVQEEEDLNKDLILNNKKEQPISKTIKLPYRNLTCRAQQPDILVNGIEMSKAKDDKEFVKFVKENNPEFIKEEVKWGDYKKTLTQNGNKYVDSNGQPIDCISLIEKGNKFDWKENK